MTDLTKKTESELREIQKAGEAAGVEISRRYVLVEREISRRLDAGELFKFEELVFAKYAKCACGEKLAYPRHTGGGGYWDCSAILLRTADKSLPHADQKPFVFWKIKAES